VHQLHGVEVLLDVALEEALDDAGVDPATYDQDDPALVDRVTRLVDAAEYKRRQYPPGTKISFKAFGRDRRLPITNRFESTVDPAERRLRALK